MASRGRGETYHRATEGNPAAGAGRSPSAPTIADIASPDGGARRRAARFPAVPIDWEPLIFAARAARKKAYAPYSRFEVGAAVLAADGSIYAGANVENRTFGLSLCAERVAVASAVAAGRRTFQAIAVASDADPPARPCGLCLETLSEFAPDLPILLVNPRDAREILTLRQLFPQPFVFTPPAGRT